MLANDLPTFDFALGETADLLVGPNRSASRRQTNPFFMKSPRAG